MTRSDAGLADLGQLQLSQLISRSNQYSILDSSLCECEPFSLFRVLPMRSLPCFPV